MNKYTEDDLREELKTKEYEYGFYTDIASDTFPNGLNEDIVRAISLKKEEPQWMTDWRLEAFKAWKKWLNQNGPMYIIKNQIFKLFLTIQHQTASLNTIALMK